jgi:hypothetical protein
MRHTIAIVFIVLAFSGFSQTPSAKRGLAYGHNKAEDLQALSKGVSWYYNWNYQPESSVINVYEDYNFDYVPMAWNGAFDKQAMHDFLSSHPNVKYILGFNEPNFIDQASMTPSQAAAVWPDIEELADEFGLEIVSPAVNYCGNCVSENGTTYTDPVKYLDDFFTACVGCRVDHIAIHCYMANVSALQWYVGLFKKYGKPIWLTEFAAWEGQPTLQEQKSFMIGAVDYLETDPDVFRYAWFTGRFDNVSPFIGLLQNFGNLTDLGKIYVNMPMHDPSAYTAIPARIEAETYNRMSGVSLEATQDISGFANVGYIDANDWMEYNIDVPEAGSYFFNIRLASMQEGTIRVTQDGLNISTVNFTNTGGWQTWKTFMFKLDLDAGQHALRLIAPSGGFNLNWIELTDEIVLHAEDDEPNTITLFPNPVSDRISIDAGPQWKKFEVLNVMGVKFIQGDVKSFVDLDALAAGPYVMKFINRDGKVVFKRVIKR